MGIVQHSKFHQFKSAIASLEEVNERTLKSQTFLIEKDEKRGIEIYYAPFDYINKHAKVVIVGITPGFYQMKQAYEAVRAASREKSDEEILQDVKKRASLSGPLRKNLTTMLDELHLHKYFKIQSTNELFGEANGLVHTVSVLSYPVFYKGKNYNGTTPDILRTDLLKYYIITQFAQEIMNIEKPLIIPLGINVSRVLFSLAEDGYLDKEHIVSGFPHPSGGNGHRHKQFAQNKEAMKRQLYEHFIK
ncbi:hypothetical protein [Metabacillus malikii]|uniref:Uracil DNA glycosylase superfamily protein n=1 Tax=Metabacillus malikii TaxID=1504265 RepID=A0ABT9ZF37_9BACI|nr:hypothetical protein [Metabacillus malikii]MDQ0230892.1 hypothetical protein [Metabacillus malikii]